jgi:cytochrome c oxidase subunit 1
MSLTVQAVDLDPQKKPESYLSASGIFSWLLTTDHKRIGLLYLFSITGFFAIGAIAALVMRLNLLTPRGDLVQAAIYNRLFTLHGVLMVWFFLIPSIPNVLGNFTLPIMIGARDLAFPKLNLLSWYLFIFGGAFVLYAILVGGADTGWTFYTPYSSTYANSHVVLMATGIFISGFSSILTGLNFIVTYASNACTRSEVVQTSTICVVQLRHQHHPRAGNPGPGNHALSIGPGTDLEGRRL